MTVADVTVKNEKVLRQVARAVHLSQGQFSLMRLRCDYRRLRLEWSERLRQFCQTEYGLSVPILELEATDDRLYAQLKAFVDGVPEVPHGVQVVGFEALRDRETLFSTANQIRETLRESFPLPLLFWLDEASVVQLMASANDLHSWSTGKRFLASGRVLRETLQAKAEGLVRQVLTADDAALVGGVPLVSAAVGQEIRRINQVLTEAEEPLAAEVETGLTLLLGRLAYEQGDWAEAGRQWERCLALCSAQVESNPEGRGAVLFQLGLVALKRAEEEMAARELTAADKALEKAETLFQESVGVWQRVGHPEIGERFRDCSVVQLLSVWRRGQEVLNRVGWGDEENPMEPVGQTGSNDVGNPTEDESTREGVLGSAGANPIYGKAMEILAPLVEMESWGFPQLKLRGLAQLQRLYFGWGEYGRAFEVRQAQEAEERVAGVRAFIGAGRLQPGVGRWGGSRSHSLTSGLLPEIEQSGRGEDVRELLARIDRYDCRLIVIYGPSGVGKSSLVTAGLIPALRGTVLGGRENWPIVIRRYKSCQLVFAAAVLEEEESSPILSKRLTEDGWDDVLSAILDVLKSHESEKRRPVLILDQFEEFFFAQTTTTKRRQFFQALGQVLTDRQGLPSTTVVLSLREDYLHYLLEWLDIEVETETGRQRLGLDILSQQVLYGVGNLTEERTRRVIELLTEKTPLSLEACTGGADGGGSGR